MDKKNGKMNEKEKPTWDWTHVECYLKTVQNSRKSSIWNLAPSIILTNPSSDNAGPNVRLYIDTEKALQYSNQLGWNWHKSWNIPNISLRLEIKDDNTGDFLLSPRNLYAQIFAVKKNTENEKGDRMTLIDVGIRGESKMQMIDGQVYFSAIKFSSTTYNNEGINFNLLIVLYINQGEFEKPKVLTAVISPPIFVDSRRSARDYQEKKFSSFVEPFAYDTLDKEFIKRENKSKNETQIVIKNDPEGFYNYITAPNIRHKVKHPVFLAIKFSSCVKIFYNTKLVQFTEVKDAIQNLQNKLLKQTKAKQKNDPEISGNLEEKHFLFVVSNLTDSLKRKKVLQSIQTMQNEFIGITCVTQNSFQNFEAFENIDTLKKGYKEAYENLVAICQNYQPEDQDESLYDDESYPEESSESSKKVKREVVEPIRTNLRNKTSIISNSKNQAFERPKDRQEETILKKEELFESQFDAPAFFIEPQEEKQRNNNSAFTKRIGFKNVNENPIFDTTELNKAFASNMANPQQIKKLPTFLDPKQSGQKNQQHLNANYGLNRQQGFTQGSQSKPGGNINMGGFNLGPMGNLGGLGLGGGNVNNSVYDNLMYSNLMLSNWLGTIKNNNNTLYENMGNNNIGDQMLHKNNIQRYLQAEQQQKMLQMGRIPLQNEDQQSIISLVQQIGLYKELLSQVTYQNQLLSRDISMRQNIPMNQMKYPQQDQYSSALQNLQGGLGSMNFMGNMNSSLQNLMGGQNIPNLSGLQGQNIQGSGVKNYSDPQRYSGNLMGNQVQNITLTQGRGLEKPVEEKEVSYPQGNEMGMGMGMRDLSMMGQDMMGNYGMRGMSNNYEMIRNMVLQDLKKEAENKQKQKKE